MQRLRKSPRIKGFDYKGGFAYFLTVVTRRRLLILSDRSAVKLVLQALDRSLSRYGFTLYAYCFMPDHLHLLVSGNRSHSLKGFMQHFKQLSGYAYKQVFGQPLWQTSYYDRTLRSDEDLLTTARYIWGNPVRAGLVDDARDYKSFGSEAAARGVVMEQA